MKTIFELIIETFTETMKVLLPLFAIIDLLIWFMKWFGGHGHISSEANWIFGLLFIFFLGTFLVLEYLKAVKEDKEREEKMP
jgi:hypothetical protein